MHRQAYALTDLALAADLAASLALPGPAQAHIVTRRIPAVALAQGVQLTSFAGTQLSIAAAGGDRTATIDAPGGVTARVVQGDIAYTNGVIHGIDHVLIR